MSTTAVPFNTQVETVASANNGWRDQIGTGLRASLILLMSTAAPAIEEPRTPTAPAAIVSDRQGNSKRRRYRAQVEHGMARLKQFAKYRDDWDSRGAIAPTPIAIDAALRYLTFLQPWHPNPLATVNREGETILEFDDDDAFSSIRFRDENGLFVELYRRPKGALESAFKEGQAQDAELNAFILEHLKLPTLPHDFV